MGCILQFTCICSIMISICFVSFKGVLQKIIESAIPGATVCTLCQLGDDLIKEETSKVFKKGKDMKKGNFFSILQ